MKETLSRHATAVGAILATAVVACSSASTTPPDEEGARHERVATVTAALTTSPNILLIQADDLGFSDLGCLGSEIATPNLDALVDNGRLLTNHHSGTVSAIMRAMLISGTDHHLVGLGTMGAPGDERTGLPGYETFLNDRALSIADLLQDAGYHTYISGKWHLGSALPGDPTASTVGKTADQWGFERSYTLIGGFAPNHFGYEPAGSKNWTEDGTYVLPPNDVHSATNLTNKMIEYIDSNAGDGKPFFAYTTYLSPHWPLQVPEPWLSMYADDYDEGYEPIRAARIERLRKLGLLGKNTDAAPFSPEALVPIPGTPNDGKPEARYINPFNTVEDGYVDYHGGVVDKDWDSLSDLEKKAQARYMEIYAGMVTHLDYEVGRLIQHLKDIGQYENTMILFHSDNGADGWPMNSLDPKSVDEAMAAPGVYETLGTANAPRPTPRGIQYGRRWAEVSNTPLSMTKGFQSEGGISTPAIVKMPGQKKGAKPYTRFTHAIDEPVTFLALAGVEPPSEPAPPAIDPETGEDLNEGKVVYEGRAVYPMTGHSMVHVLGSSSQTPIREEPFGTESYGRAALYSADGQWKIRWTEPAFGPLDGHWELFHISKDPGETKDLSAKHPDKVELLAGQWVDYLDRTGAVEPLRPKGYYP